MKQLLILLSILLIPALSTAQDSHTYRTLEDLLANQPAEEIPPTFRYERQRHQGKLRGQKIAAYRFKGPREYKLPKTKTFAVYMDGSLFINLNRPKLRKNTDFFKVEWIGNYGYFVDIHKYPVWIDEVYMEDTILKEMLLDRSTGTIIELSKKNLRIILQDHPKLLQDFERERKKKKKLKEYLVLSAREA
ncbi:MAG: hypothetical protein R8G66_21105 [Cytophagales bacterium]|nr:hypothetical protein [Cytophagales bacterium]